MTCQKALWNTLREDRSGVLECSWPSLFLFPLLSIHSYVCCRTQNWTPVQLAVSFDQYIVTSRQHQISWNPLLVIPPLCTILFFLGIPSFLFSWRFSITLSYRYDITVLNDTLIPGFSMLSGIFRINKVRSSRPEVFCQKVFLVISQNSQENRPQACIFIKKETLAQVFTCEFCEISKNTFFHRTPLAAASTGSSFSLELPFSWL